MAYQSKNLSALGYANGFTLWHYRTDDALADTLAVSYFDAAVRMLRAGDVVIVNASVDSGPRETAQLTVTSLDGGAVAVVAMTAAIAETEGAPADGVEITDEMVEAGLDCWRDASGTMVECFREALEAALRARRQP